MTERSGLRELEPYRGFYALAFVALLGAPAAAQLAGCGGDELPGSACLEGEALNGDGSCGPVEAGGQGGAAGAPAGQAGQGGAGASGEGGQGGMGPPKVTVAGKTFYAETGGPVSGAKVWVNGRVVLTNGEGKFEAPDVELPYQLAYLSSSPSGGSEYFFYDGVRTTEPAIRLEGAPLGGSMRVTGTLAGSGVHPQEPSTYRSELVALAPNGLVVGEGEVIHASGETPSSAFDVQLRWPTSLGSSLAVKLYALQKRVTNVFSNGVTESFLGYGFKALTVNAGQNLSGQTITLGPVTNQYVQFNVSLPPATALNAKYATGQYKFAPDGPSFRYEGADPADISSPPFSFLVPKLGGGSADVSLYLGTSNFAFSTTHWVRQLAPTVTEMTFSPKEPVTVGTPAEGETLAAGSRLSWSALDGAVHCARFAHYDEGSTCPGNVSLCTTEASVELPDLSAFGLPLSGGGSCRLTVESRGPFASVDAFLADLASGNETFAFDAVSASRIVNLP